MRKTLSSFTSSFSDLLHGQSPQNALDTRQEEIRSAMLASLAEIESSQPHAFSKTLVTITQAADVESLWDARSDLLRLIADRNGELAARKTLDGITEMFRGLVPNSLLPSRRRVPR
jgi:hypothetical protein